VASASSDLGGGWRFSAGIWRRRKRLRISERRRQHLRISVKNIRKAAAPAKLHLIGEYPYTAMATA